MRSNSLSSLPKKPYRLRWVATLLCFFATATAQAGAFGGPSAEDLIRRGDEAFYERNYKKSELYYNQAIRKKPREAMPRIVLGRLYYATTRYSAARQEFESALKLRANTETHKFLEATLAHMQDASDLLRRIENTPDTPSNRQPLVALHRAVAETMWNEHTYMSLLGHHLRYVLDADPKNAELRWQIADAYYLSSDPMSAVVLYEELARLRPRDRVLLKRLADTYIALGRFDQATLSYKKALREAVRSRDRVEIAELQKLIRSMPVTIGKVRAMIEDDEDYKLAWSALKRRVDLNNGDLGAMVLMGTVYEELDRHNKAERLYRAALKLDPEYPYAHFYMGRLLLLKKKDFEGAVRELMLFKKYLRSASQRPGMTDKIKKSVVQDRVASCRYLAYIYGEVLNKRIDAINEIHQALALEPQNAELHYELGVAYARAKKRSSAYTAFKKVISLDPKAKIAKDAEEAIDIIRSQSDYGSYTGPYD